MWLKDGIKIHHANGKSDDNSLSRSKNSDSVSITQNNDFTSTLSITSISKTQAGDYTCRVKNDAATVEEKALLEVNGKENENDVHEGLMVVDWDEAFDFQKEIINFSTKKKVIYNNLYFHPFFIFFLNPKRYLIFILIEFFVK